MMRLPLLLSVLPIVSSFSSRPPTTCGTQFTCEEEATKIGVFGHSSPDTDAVSAAIIYAWELLNPPPDDSPGFSGPTHKQCAKAYVNTDEINPETAFVLDYFREKEPPILPNISALPVGADFAVVDTNSIAQMPSGTTKDVVKDHLHSIVDHHKLDGLTTSAPTEIDIRPIASAGLMLATILSDTLGLTSSTTTEGDKTAVKYLAPLAGVASWENFTYQMLVAKSNEGFEDPDGKTFNLRIAVQETVRESVKEFFPGFPAKATYIPSPPTYPADYTNCSFVDPLTKHTYGPYAKASLPPPPPNPHNRRTPHSRLQHDPQFYAGFNPLCLQALVMGEWFETADGATVTPREYLKNGVQSRKKQIVPGLNKIDGGAKSTTYSCSQTVEDYKSCPDEKYEPSESDPSPWDGHPVWRRRHFSWHDDDDA
ncbi:hypothetical protein EMIHUDRAFT_119031 [Emiliania huxleyi CCMP1516]|uniref:DDH domain-containing protein n=2 Tax=Emiliania huxleyi TaxID=2903 RepID=A0A0D3IYX9_EMIH1|nr:hypothetical protein EMIHUDRAFT_119031 [Emiliania huxleyi CCMP1516]EOD16464.1 hypothetical protein EMIHUDRAFT_119031 [Emiliania huxleyi CCMP1516]|eukprot:XP_005768893.1 hypothetical protein EMIHUDRAFT_119031 [Emiliania huxleyi CCMP1516]